MDAPTEYQVPGFDDCSVVGTTCKTVMRCAWNNVKLAMLVLCRLQIWPAVFSGRDYKWRYDIHIHVYLQMHWTRLPCGNPHTCIQSGRQSEDYRQIISQRFAPCRVYPITQITKFMGPTWGPPGSCRPQMSPMLAPWTSLSGNILTRRYWILQWGHNINCRPPTGAPSCWVADIKSKTRVPT